MKRFNDILIPAGTSLGQEVLGLTLVLYKLKLISYDALTSVDHAALAIRFKYHNFGRP